MGNGKTTDSSKKTLSKSEALKFVLVKMGHCTIALALVFKLQVYLLSYHQHLCSQYLFIITVWFQDSLFWGGLFVCLGKLASLSKIKPSQR